MSNDSPAKVALERADVLDRPLAYVDNLDLRSLGQIRRVVMHATELPDLATAREYGERVLYENSKTGNSGHFYIDRDGSIEQWVPLDRIAHHVRDHNADTIGIELVNRGRYPNWLATDSQDWLEPYSPEQIERLIRLLKVLSYSLPNLNQIIGHEHLDTEQVEASDDPAKTVLRKTDPGPQFPWSQVVEASGMLFIGSQS